MRTAIFMLAATLSWLDFQPGGKYYEPDHIADSYEVYDIRLPDATATTNDIHRVAFDHRVEAYTNGIWRCALDGQLQHHRTNVMLGFEKCSVCGGRKRRE